MKWMLVVSLARLGWSAVASELPVVAPEVYQYAPLRAFGTNLYDFSEAIQSVLKGHPNPTYCIRGLTVQTNVPGVPGSMIVRRATGTPGYVLQNSSNEVSNPNDLIVGLAAISLSRTTNGILPAAQYAVLPPGVQTNFEWFQPTEEVLIANLPKEFLHTGKNVQLFALPLGRYKPRDGAFGPDGIVYFDYGQRFSGDLRHFSNLFRVTPSGIFTVKLQSRERVDPAKTLAARKLVLWQQQEATNGAAHAQYSLAKRYFTGDGVPEDSALGEHWLKKAAEQNYPDAVRLLESRRARLTPQ
jgi:hypothetical protein